MKEATKNGKGKSGLDNLEHFNKIQKNRMSEFLGGSDNQNKDTRKRGFFLGCLDRNPVMGICHTKSLVPLDNTTF